MAFLDREAFAAKQVAHAEETGTTAAKGEVLEEMLAVAAAARDALAQRPDEFELCFFAEPGSFLRMKGRPNESMYAVLRQITFRCGCCGQPVVEAEMDRHFDSHAEVGR